MTKGTNVRLEKLTKRFGRVVAVRELSLEVEPGELVAFLGPSGCGKTTTLLMIAGIYRPTAGHVYFGERRVDALHPKDRDVGMVFQRGASQLQASIPITRTPWSKSQRVASGVTPGPRRK